MRIGILTGGGDAPGLNAVIRAAVRSALNRGWEVLGIRRGFEGLLDTRLVAPLGAAEIAGILHRGGTILGTSNRVNPFHVATGSGVIDRSGEVVANARALGIDALVVIGGDGTLGIARDLALQGLAVVGVPKTIDNDLSATVVTFGFDTAVANATDALDKLHSTAQSHERVMVVEVMGRYSGWIALHAGLAGGADVILIPELPFRWESICAKVEDLYATGQNFAIVVVAEGATPAGSARVVKHGSADGHAEVLGGIGEQVASEIAARTGRETRSLVLGHLQRGGEPTSFDRIVGSRFGAAAIRLVEQKAFGMMVALHPPEIHAVPLADAVDRMKTVPLAGDTMQTARDLGISFGD